MTEFAEKYVLVRHGGNNRKAYVIRESGDDIYVRFWSSRRRRWDVQGLGGIKSGSPVPKKNVIQILEKLE
jgi:hypothetical protein